MFSQSIDEKINTVIEHLWVGSKSVVNFHDHRVKNLRSAHLYPALTNTIAKDGNTHWEYVSPAYTNTHTIMLF